MKLLDALLSAGAMIVMVVWFGLGLIAAFPVSIPGIWGPIYSLSYLFITLFVTFAYGKQIGAYFDKLTKRM